MLENRERLAGHASNSNKRTQVYESKHFVLKRGFYGFKVVVQRDFEYELETKVLELNFEQPCICIVCACTWYSKT